VFAQTALAAAPWRDQQRALMELAPPLATFGIAAAVLLVIRHLLVRSIARRLQDRAHYQRVLLSTIRVPSVLWCLAAAVGIALRFSTLSESQVRVAGLWIVIFLIVSLSLAAASLAVRTLTLYGERQGVPLAVAGLSRTLIYVLILSIGGMILMRYLNLSITPLIATLGVSGLAVALALQDTLANFFAGVHILVETPINLGDFILLSTGEEGMVIDIGWRTTRVRTGANNVIVIPNTKITSGILTNFSLPDPRVMTDVAVVVDHAADPGLVRKILEEEVRSCEGVLPAPAPAVLFDPGVTLTHLQFKVLFHVSGPAQKGGVQSALRLQIYERLRTEGIGLPKAREPQALRA
jgi:small-conductance mechanosensitive channel